MSTMGKRLGSCRWLAGSLGALLALIAPTAAVADDYALFEAGQVRPLALDAKAEHLYAVNTPDDRLEIFKLKGRTPELVGSVAVGMRPVSVALRGTSEAWVVNHLSDSVSVVDISDPRQPRVVRTLLVGDEPRDIVFAGTGRNRAFITTAHRGQNVPFDPQLTTPGVGRADVWVFDARNLGDSLPGTPLTIITLFADTPRALAVSDDGATVYAAAFASGNLTTSINEGVSPVLRRGQRSRRAAAPDQHRRALRQRLLDRRGRQRCVAPGQFHAARLRRLHDRRQGEHAGRAQGPGATFRGVGTTLFNMAINPRSGALYVSNTEANNITRFEGPGLVPDRNTTVRGNIAQSRITVIKDGSSTPIHLNKHIDYSAAATRPAIARRARAWRRPREMVVSRDGRKLYVTAHGSSKIGVFDTDKLETNRFVPERARPHQAQRWRSDRARARRGAQAPVRAHALQQRDRGARYPGRFGDRIRSDAQPRAGQHRPGPPRALRCVRRKQSRRLVLRQLSHRRRHGSAGLGPG